jgi:hypothetical protein
MAYQHDVFLSYLHVRPSGTWVHEHFLPYFSFQLGNAINRWPDIFIDRTGIHLGQKWPIRLKQALAHSRCLVGIWCPLYFQSEWCQNECAIICYRENQLGYGRGGNSQGLLVGVKVNDGIHFPTFAKDSQFADFERYFYDESGFASSELYVEFQRKVAEFAEGVARVIKKAPPWSAEWETPAWTDDVIEGVQALPKPKVQQPTLD